MLIKFAKTNPKISAEDLVEFEKAHNIKLPEDYRQFLLETNGGKPSQENDLIPYKLHDGTDSYYPILRFFGVKDPVENDDLAKVNYRLNQSDGDRNLIPPKCLAIAEIDGGHEFLGISLAAKRYGYIYVWNYHYNDYDNADLIAESFTEFLDLLCDGSEVD